MTPCIWCVAVDMWIVTLVAVVACLVPTFGARDDDVRHLVNVNLDFGLKLYKQLARYDMHNICFSPYTYVADHFIGLGMGGILYEISHIRRWEMF